MADNTNRFGLNTYSQGDTNWDHTDAVQTIDELAIERDTIANRPDSGDYDDELYLATDQQILYRWDADATDWIVEGVGSETDPLPKVWANEIDANSVVTESASVNGPLDAETATVGDDIAVNTSYRYDGYSHGQFEIFQEFESGESTAFRSGGQFTDAVGTTATTIWEDTGERAAFVVVAGRDDREHFIDVLLKAFREVTVIGSNERDSPSSRSYAEDGSHGIELSMEDGSYDVGAKGTGISYP